MSHFSAKIKICFLQIEQSGASIRSMFQKNPQLK